MVKLFIMLFFFSVMSVAEVQPTTEELEEGKSRKKALALSVLLPGLGEQYMGRKSDAMRAYIIEGGIWCAFFGARWYGGVMANDCILYAYANAGAKIGQNEKYYDAVEWYENLEAYNTSVREKARKEYPDSREKQLEYIEEHSLPESLWWEWRDTSAWDNYRRLRSKCRRVFRNTTYCIGVAILHRIVSAIIATNLPTSGIGLEIEPRGVKIKVAFK